MQKRRIVPDLSPSLENLNGNPNETQNPDEKDRTSLIIRADVQPVAPEIVETSKNPEDISEAPVKVKPRTRGKKNDGKYNKPIEYKRILISGRLLDAANQEIINVLLNEKRMLSYNEAICRLVGFKNTK